MTARLLLLCVGVLAVAATTACGDPFKATATVQNIDDTLALYGLSEAPANGPTGINTFVPRAVRADPSQNYDILFDIRPDSSGARTAYILPPRAVGLFGSAGIIKDSTQAFEEITQAPVRGYDDSTAVPIKAGDVLLVQAASFACASQLITDRRVIYSKIVIDSVNYSPFDPDTNPAGSTIHLRMRVDPNCGFISFADGLPGF
ncbi:MAG TPA: hypothetical protein VFS44_06410 [Gemmatimonadaceae bacterium]|nr:hypothetical protein [Gemmatimonadaceae bacterium]